MSEYLSPEELTELRDAALEAGYAYGDARRQLFYGILPAYCASLPMFPAPGQQLLADLHAMNAVERLTDGTVPLEIWLRNAIAQTNVAAPVQIFQKALDRVARTAGGEPDVMADAAEVEFKEEIIHRDDMISFRFLRDGDRAGLAVARVKIPPFHDGRRQEPSLPHLGTGWLIAPGLLITNRHVVNARKVVDGARPLATPDDLRLQAGAASASFGYDIGWDDVEEASATGLVALDQRLDYAILRLAAAPERPVLRVSAEPLVVIPGEPVAVNIIQHPGGEPKRVALRNNLVYEADRCDVRYFTDTRRGSSGSPVCTDDWKVVALHRGTRKVENVKFQGKLTAYVNVGSQMSAILSHLRQAAPEVYEEVEDAQPG